MANIRKSGSCDYCNNYARDLRRYKDHKLCWKCFMKSALMVWSTTPTRPRTTLEQALEKVYEIHGHTNKKGGFVALRSFPSVLIGRKIRISLVEDEEKV